MSLSIEAFRKLSRAERERRYVELSPHDKLTARIEDWGAPNDLPKVTTEDFLEHPPNGWEFVTKEMLEEMFPDKKG